MKSSARKVLLTVLLASTSSFTSIAPSRAQTAAPAAAEASPDPSDIVVTARKRQESILKVPVVVTAVSELKLERLQVTAMTDLPKLVPGLVLGNNLLSIGTQVAIRGVGTSSSDPGVDQSVSLNIDGLALGSGLAFASGLFDLAQIEVLKGPQALFYGKSSPGGVISLRTADPTDQFEVIGRAAYEIEARERRGELIVSGPLSETLKARLAGNYSAADGYFRNVAVPTPGTGAAAPNKRDPRSKNYMVRGTLLWNPTARFSARLKVNIVHDRSINAEASQLVSCPGGSGPGPSGLPFLGGDDCKLDREIRSVYMDPASFAGIPNDGVPYVQNDQKYGTLELNYDLTPQLSLNSTTGYYNLRSSSSVNTFATASAGTTLAFWNRFRRRDFTEELRLNSDFSGPVNFTAGAFYQDGRLFDRVTDAGNEAYGLGFIQGDGSTTIDIKTYSAFGQLRWKITPYLEVAGGARYTDETRREDVFNYITNAPISVAVPRINSRNVAPEATITFTPTDDLTLFAAYKRAYKSGSFSVATVPNPGANNSFGDERVEGGEIGLKSRLLDRRMAVNIAAYHYKYTGLQVGGIEPAIGGLPIIRTVNAGAAKAYGIDFDASYRPRAIDGLSLNASVNWNHGNYTKLDNVPCYIGQTIAAGCTQFLNSSSGLYTAQNLSGTPLIRAPRWQSTFGFDYEYVVGRDMKVVFSNSNQYSSRFATFLAVGRPNDDNFQKSYLKSDVSLALQGRDNRWELAVIGKNIGDKVTAGNCSASDFRNGGIFGGYVTGGTATGPAGTAPVGCYGERGRSIWLRVTIRPFAARN